MYTCTDRFGVQTSSTGFSASNHMLVILDTGVADYQTLANGVISEAEVVILDRHQDGIEQITQALQQRSHITQLHIVSHGSPGCLYLGHTRFSLETIDRYGWDLQSWSVPSILLYGCNVAAGDAGAEFIEKLHHLTGANIAASNKPIGNMALGGQWQLNARVGVIDAPLAFNAEVMGAYAHILALPGPHSAQVGSEVFLGGDYVELGINSGGAFGTQNSKPAGFNGTTARANVGMSVDLDGFSTGTLGNGDYFLPGTPEER